jgi:hypothetical protein
LTFASQPVVAVEDAGGNTVTTDTSSVTLSITALTPTSGGPGTLTCTSPTNTVAAVAGVATFAGCKIVTIGTSYKLTAADGALTAAQSSAFSIDAVPTITSLSPNTSGNPATVAVTITGTGFLNGAGVAFSLAGGSGLTVSSYTVNSSTSITVNLTIASGAGPVGGWSVKVTNPDGGVSNTYSPFTVT